MKRKVKKIFKPNEEQQKWIEENQKGISRLELSKKFNKKFKENFEVNQFRNYLTKKGLRNGLDTKFKVGKVPDNGHRFVSNDPRSIPYQFKKGHISHTTLPIGTIREHYGYQTIKVEEPNVWKKRHQLIWEEHYGEIPKGHRVMFKDQDKSNLTIENLMLVKEVELAMMNRFDLVKPNKTLTEIGHTVSKIIIKRAELKRS